MTQQEYNEYIATRRTVICNSAEHGFMHKAAQDAIRITMEINSSYHTPDELRALLSQLTGTEIDSSVGLFPPIYTDYGKNLHIGKMCLSIWDVNSRIKEASLSETAP